MVESVKLLLDNGADPNKCCAKGKSPLHDVVAWYCRCRQQSGAREKCGNIINQLIHSGCDHRIMDNVRNYE